MISRSRWKQQGAIARSSTVTFYLSNDATVLHPGLQPYFVLREASATTGTFASCVEYVCLFVPIFRQMLLSSRRILYSVLCTRGKWFGKPNSRPCAPGTKTTTFYVAIVMVELEVIIVVVFFLVFQYTPESACNIAQPPVRVSVYLSVACAWPHVARKSALFCLTQHPRHFFR